MLNHKIMQMEKNESSKAPCHSERREPADRQPLEEP